MTFKDEHTLIYPPDVHDFFASIDFFSSFEFMKLNNVQISFFLNIENYLKKQAMRHTVKPVLRDHSPGRPLCDIRPFL